MAGAAGGVALSAGCAERLSKALPADAAILLTGVATAAGPGIMRGIVGAGVAGVIAGSGCAGRGAVGVAAAVVLADGEVGATDGAEFVAIEAGSGAAGAGVGATAAVGVAAGAA